MRSRSRRVTLITSRFWRSDIRVGFHFLAKAFSEAGWDVLFLTTHVSWIATWLGRGRDLARSARPEFNQLVTADGVASYVWYTPWHPVNLRLGLFNRLTMALFARYGALPLAVESLVAAADCIIFDCGSALLLFERAKRLNPRAPFVYRVSDDIRHRHVHPIVLAAEEKAAPRFDLISVPCSHILERSGGDKLTNRDLRRWLARHCSAASLDGARRAV